MTPTPTEPKVLVVADDDAVADAAADRIATALTEAVTARGRADWATTGGSLAPAIYRHLAEPRLRDVVPWHAVHVWWGDDRYVPKDHPLSNVKPLDDILLAIGWTQSGQLALGESGEAVPVPLPIENLHPFPTTEAIGRAYGAAWCAAWLADELAAAGLELDGPWPILDLVLLGVGADGHVLSVFPGSAALDAPELALAVPAPTHIEPHVERVTLNPAVIGAARQVLVAAAGAAKAGILGEVFGAERDPARWPAQLARREGATWILDTDAAAALPR
jgi:6-phosphogluconolactonase